MINDEEIETLDTLKPMMWAVKTIGNVQDAQKALNAIKSLLKRPALKKIANKKLKNKPKKEIPF